MNKTIRPNITADGQKQLTLINKMLESNLISLNQFGSKEETVTSLTVIQYVGTHNLSYGEVVEEILHFNSHTKQDLNKFLFIFKFNSNDFENDNGFGVDNNAAYENIKNLYGLFYSKGFDGCPVCFFNKCFEEIEMTENELLKARELELKDLLTSWSEEDLISENSY